MLETSKLKQLLGISDEGAGERDAYLSFILSNIEEIICNYCNISKIPHGLEHTAYRMAMDMYRNEAIGEEESAGRVSSIKEGDVTVNISSSYDTDFSSSVLKKYEYQLNRYRRLRW